MVMRMMLILKTITKYSFFRDSDDKYHDITIPRNRAFIVKENYTFMQNLLDTVKERKRRPNHPGEVILDILEDIEISQTQFAKMLGVSRRTVNQIIQGHRPITVDMAIRIGKAFGNGPALWLNLQQNVDVWDALQKYEEEYNKIVTVQKYEEEYEKVLTVA